MIGKFYEVEKFFENNKFSCILKYFWVKNEYSVFILYGLLIINLVIFLCM